LRRPALMAPARRSSAVGGHDFDRGHTGGGLGVLRALSIYLVRDE
jgi:hypothetical protein